MKLRYAILAVSAVSILALCATIVLPFLSAEDACSHLAGTQARGTQGWSWLPPGVECVYDVHVVDGAQLDDATITMSPSWFTLTTLAFVVLSLFALAATLRNQDEDQPSASSV